MTVTYNVYRSLTPMDVNAMPAAIASGLTVKNYSDTTGTLGENYFYRIGSEKNGVEVFSDEKPFLFGPPWTPSNLTEAPQVWLNTSNVTVDVSNRISQATNMGSLASTNFTQATDANKPVLSNAEFNFDGTDLLRTTNRSIIRNNSKLWAFCISKLTDSSGFRRIFWHRTPSTNDRFLIQYNAGNLITSFRVLDGDNFVTRTTPSTLNKEHMYLVAIDVTTKEVEVWLDGTKVIDDTFTTSGTVFEDTAGSQDTSFGGDLSGSFIGSMRDFLLGTTALPTATEIDKIFGWAAHKYGLTANLPAGHPYKNSIPSA